MNRAARDELPHEGCEQCGGHGRVVVGVEDLDDVAEGRSSRIVARQAFCACDVGKHLQERAQS